MSRDIYAALSGASASWAQLEVLSNNVANVSTTAYKGARLTFSLDGPGDDPRGKVYAQPTAVAPDMRDGALVQDGVATHLALQGEGFFAVQAGDRVLLTRDGRFHVDEQGMVVDVAGRPLLGEGGPIELAPGESMRVDETGLVVGDQSGELDRLRVVTGAVRPVGDGMWEAEGPLVAGGARVLQGALEGSNVEPMRAMVELIEASRYFEAYQKAMRASDEADERMNQSGGPR